MHIFTQQLPGLSVGLLRIMFAILWLDAALQKAPWVINAQGQRCGALLCFSGAIALSYFAYMQDYPTVPTGIHLLEFLPLYLLLLVQVVWQRGHSAVLGPAAAVLMEQPNAPA